MTGSSHGKTSIGIFARLALGLLLLTPGCAPGGGSDPGADLDTGGPPPDAEEARPALETSPRHGEWVTIGVGAGDSVRAWVVHPERSDAAPVVVVVHEIYGLTAWVRSVADALAAEGFLAVAPDLLTGREVPAGESGDPEREAAVEAVRSLDADRVHARIRGAADWARDLPSTTDRYAVIGFCWGGSVSFEHAAHSDEVGAAVVYYGSSPEAEALHRVAAPVLGLYGGDDERVNSTVPRADSVLSERGRTFEAHVYEGAGHGFLRQRGDRDGANVRASERAWPETVRFLRRHLEGD